VGKNPMATKVLGELVAQSYGPDIRINLHADSIYMGALGAALFALDDVAAGRPGLLPASWRSVAAEPAMAGGMRNQAVREQAAGAGGAEHVTAGIDPAPAPSRWRS
jgi:hypothetical protein